MQAALAVIDTGQGGHYSEPDGGEYGQTECALIEVNSDY
jgi:hypothetical protein